MIQLHVILKRYTGTQSVHLDSLAFGEKILKDAVSKKKKSKKFKHKKLLSNSKSEYTLYIHVEADLPASH